MFPWIPFLSERGVDDLPDNFISIERFVGSLNISRGDVSIGVNDEDTVKYLHGNIAQAEGDILSVHDDDNTDYKNTTGFDAITVLTINVINTGVATRHIKVYSGPTTDSTSGATLVWEVGQVDNDFYDGDGDAITTPPLKIQNNHFIIVENVDDSRAGTNNFQVTGTIVTGVSVNSIVVERGA